MLSRLYKKIFYKDPFQELTSHGVFVHPQSELGENTKIGKGTNINGPAYITSSSDAPVRIGRYCAIAYNLRIRSKNHYMGYANLQGKFQSQNGLPSLSTVKGAVVIGNNVWVGDNVIILSGVEIGDGAVIGAGAVVTKNVENYTIVAGNPARFIRKRFSDNVIKQLNNIRWWEWSDERIRQNKSFFEIDLSESPEIDLDKFTGD